MVCAIAISIYNLQDVRTLYLLKKMNFNNILWYLKYTKIKKMRSIAGKIGLYMIVWMSTLIINYKLYL